MNAVHFNFLALLYTLCYAYTALIQEFRGYPKKVNVWFELNFFFYNFNFRNNIKYIYMYILANTFTFTCIQTIRRTHSFGYMGQTRPG